MERPAWLLTVKFDSSNNLFASVHTDCIILRSVKFDDETRKYYFYYFNYATLHRPVLVVLFLYCIVSIHLYSASFSAHQSEALSVRETQRAESSLERTKRGTWLTS